VAWSRRNKWLMLKKKVMSLRNSGVQTLQSGVQSVCRGSACTRSTEHWRAGLEEPRGAQRGREEPRGAQRRREEPRGGERRREEPRGAQRSPEEARGGERSPEERWLTSAPLFEWWSPSWRRGVGSDVCKQALVMHNSYKVRACNDWNQFFKNSPEILCVKYGRWRII